MNHARRAFLGTATIFSAWGLLQLLPGCSSADETRTPAQPQPKKRTSAVPPTDDDEFVDEEPEPTPPVSTQRGNAEWTAKAADLESKNAGGKAYTVDSPGPFPGKDRAHVPVMTIQPDGVAAIIVHHVMDAGSPGTEAGAPSTTPTDAGKTDAAVADAGYVDSGARPMHYVSTIWIKDDQGRVIFMKSYEPSDASPPFVAIRIPDGVKSLTAYEHCNLHGVWASASQPV